MLGLRNQKLKRFNLLGFDHSKCYKRALIVMLLHNEYIVNTQHNYMRLNTRAKGILRNVITQFPLSILIV